MGEGGVVGREEAKAPQVKTRGSELPTDGPDHTTRLKGHHSVEFQANKCPISALHRCQCVGHGFTRV